MQVKPCKKREVYDKWRLDVNFLVQYQWIMNEKQIRHHKVNIILGVTEVAVKNYGIVFNLSTGTEHLKVLRE